MASEFMEKEMIKDEDSTVQLFEEWQDFKYTSLYSIFSFEKAKILNFLIMFFKVLAIKQEPYMLRSYDFYKKKGFFNRINRCFRRFHLLT